MNKNIEKPDLEQTNIIITGLKNCLEKYFGKKYIQTKMEVLEENNLNNLETKCNDFTIFEVIKKNPPIYTLLNSSSDLAERKNYIKDKYKEVIDEYYYLFEEVEHDLDEKTIESLEIIGKLLENRQKKMDSAFKKFVPDDSWDITKIQDEFSHVLVKILKDILESTSISISNGLKQNSVYEHIIKILNSFYSHLGIYTKEYKANDEYNDNDLDSIKPTVSQDDIIKDNSYKNKIKSVESLAYLFDEDVVVLEANITVWRMS